MQSSVLDPLMYNWLCWLCARTIITQKVKGGLATLELWLCHLRDVCLVDPNALAVDPSHFLVQCFQHMLLVLSIVLTIGEHPGTAQGNTVTQ